MFGRKGNVGDLLGEAGEDEHATSDVEIRRGEIDESTVWDRCTNSCDAYLLDGLLTDVDATS